jgi:nickel transport protein
MIVDLKEGSTEAELPLPMRIAAGFGYLLGLAGAGMLFVGLKLKKEYNNN